MSWKDITKEHIIDGLNGGLNPLLLGKSETVVDFRLVITDSGRDTFQIKIEKDT